MNVEQRVAKLESLLATVRRNAQSARPVPPSVGAEPSVEIEIDEEEELCLEPAEDPQAPLAPAVSQEAGFAPSAQAEAPQPVEQAPASADAIRLPAPIELGGAAAASADDERGGGDEDELAIDIDFDLDEAEEASVSAASTPGEGAYEASIEPEEAPQSSERPRESRFGAGAFLEGEMGSEPGTLRRETPPPESRRQVSVSPHAAPESESGPLQVDSEAGGLHAPAAEDGHPAVADDYAPNVELEEPFDGELELAEVPAPPARSEGLLRPEELLPDSEAGSAHPAGPEDAAADVAAGLEEAITQAAAVDGQTSSTAPVEESPLAQRDADAVVPASVARPRFGGGVSPTEYVRAARGFEPATFLELLDASLELGAR